MPNRDDIFIFLALVFCCASFTYAIDFIFYSEEPIFSQIIKGVSNE